MLWFVLHDTTENIRHSKQLKTNMYKNEKQRRDSNKDNVLSIF